MYPCFILLLFHHYIPFLLPNETLYLLLAFLFLSAVNFQNFLYTKGAAFLLCLSAIPFMKQPLGRHHVQIMDHLYFILFIYSPLIHLPNIEYLWCTLAQIETKGGKNHLPPLHKSPSDKQKSFKEFDNSFRGQFYLACISHIHKYY